MKTPAQLLRRVEPTERQCQKCYEPFVPFSVTALTDKLINVCPECAEKEAVSDQRAAVNRVNSQLASREKREIVPVAFRDTQAHMLPSPQMLQRVMVWKFGRQGLCLHGPTGTGKSRCAWMLASREHKAGRVVRSMDAKMGYVYAAQFAESPAVVKEWIDKHTACDILLLDDIFKVKLTESVECAIYSVFSMRTEDGKPTILTTNDTGDSILDRMSVDRGAPFVRRLRQFTRAIPFLI